MILCELEKDCIKGFELIPVKDKVKKFKEEQLAQGFRVYSANTNTSARMNEPGFKTPNINGFDADQDVYHILEMYPYDSTNKHLYEEVWSNYTEGRYDKIPVLSFSQSMELNQKVRLRQIFRAMLIEDYKKNSEYTDEVGTVTEIYRADKILELNEYLHYLQLLLQDTPEQFELHKGDFRLSDEELKIIFDNFEFTNKPAFVSPIVFLDKMQKIGLAVKDDYTELTKKSENVLKLVRSTKK